QLELHLYNPQRTSSRTSSRNRSSRRHTPLGSTNSPLIADDTATAIAKKYRLQPSDVLLGYLLAQDAVALPRLVTPAQIASNCIGTVAAVKRLAEEDLQTLEGVAVGEK
ncbi:hypothetical protein FIBSPDRAFT_737781, partial [Athelia psychrophila]